MDHILLWIGLAAVVYLLWRLFPGARRKKPQSDSILPIPSGVLLHAQPLLTEEELRLYNLIRMAVQDHYLVFARAPLRCVLHVGGDGPSRLQVLRRLALKHLDFVLVHPGSRMVEHVVQISHDQLTAEGGEEANRQEIQAMVQAAGIKCTTVTVDSAYNVRQLAELLGVSDQE